MIDTIRFPDLKALVEYGHSLSLQVGFYLNTCICMEKGRTYFEQDVAFMNEIGFDTVRARFVDMRPGIALSSNVC
jgi:hypothetical protein